MQTVIYLQLVNGIFNNFILSVTMSTAEIDHFYTVPKANFTLVLKLQLKLKTKH